MMHRFTGWLVMGLLFCLTACSAAGIAAQAAASPAPTRASIPTPNPVPTATATTTATATALPTLQPTPFTPQNCTVDSCAEAGALWLQRPVGPAAEQHAENSYLYGSTENGQRIPHSGVEFYNASGTPVLAAAAGRVAYAGSDASDAFAPWTNFYGNLIVLEHTSPRGDGLYTLYAHLSEIDVQTGEGVTAGQLIGKVGMSGSAIGSHLHFEVRGNPTDYTTTRNPFLYLLPLDSSNGGRLAVLAGQLIDQNGAFVSDTQLVAERVDLSENAPPQRFYIQTYTSGIPSDPTWKENFVLGDLEPGRYRISLVYDGRLIERFITLSAGQLTFLSLQVEN